MTTYGFTFKPLLAEWFKKRYGTPHCQDCHRKMTVGGRCKACRDKHEKPKID